MSEPWDRVDGEDLIDREDDDDEDDDGLSPDEYFYRVGAHLGYSLEDPTTNARKIYCKIDEIRVVSRTPKGVWLDCWGGRKFVLADARKKYAYPTKEEAIQSFKARKKRQITILSAQLRNAEAALKAAEEGRIE